MEKKKTSFNFSVQCVHKIKKHNKKSRKNKLNEMSRKWKNIEAFGVRHSAFGYNLKFRRIQLRSFEYIIIIKKGNGRDNNLVTRNQLTETDCNC